MYLGLLWRWYVKMEMVCLTATVTDCFQRNLSW